MARIYGYSLVHLIVLLPLAACETDLQKDNVISWEDYDGPDKDFNKAPEIYDQCENQKVCAKTKNYPTDLAKWILEKLKTERNMTFYTNEREHMDLLDTTHSMCPSKERTLYPQAAYSIDREWHFILNLNLQDIQRDRVARHFQGFYVNICDKPGASCSDFLIFTGARKKTSCEQKYAAKKMVYMDMEKKLVRIKSFQVPTCCSCKISNEIDLSIKFW